MISIALCDVDQKILDETSRCIMRYAKEKDRANLKIVCFNSAASLQFAFDACETKEELLAKAAELGVELTEENVNELMDIDEGELDDDEMDAIAGGGEGDRGWHRGYKRVWRRDDCTICQWQKAAVPAYMGVKKKASAATANTAKLSTAS